MNLSREANTGSQIQKSVVDSNSSPSSSAGKLVSSPPRGDEYISSNLRDSFTSSCAVSSSSSANATTASDLSRPNKSSFSKDLNSSTISKSDELGSSVINSAIHIAPSLDSSNQSTHPHHHQPKQHKQPLLHTNSSIKSSGSIKSKNKSNGSIKSRKSKAPAAVVASGVLVEQSSANCTATSQSQMATLPSNSSNPNFITGASGGGGGDGSVGGVGACSSSGSLRTYVNPSPSPSPTPLSNFGLNNGTNPNLAAAAGIGSYQAPGTSSTSTVVTFTSPQVSIDETTNKLVYKKIEMVIEKMQDDQSGVPIRTVKSFMSKIPSVFTGTDLIQWMLKKLDVEDTLEALHFAHLIASHGYMFPIDDHILTVKNDGTFFRFQTPYYWPSNITEPENNDYAVYLCKRTMQNKTRLELADYEAENLAKLQKLLSKKWEFIYMQAEAQIKVDKKRDKMERKILDSQERAFWDVHKPAPGCVNTTEVDIRKTMRNRRTDFPQIGFFRHHKFNAGNAPGAPAAPLTIKFADMPNGLPSSKQQQQQQTPQSPGGGGGGILSTFQPGNKKISELEELKQIDNLKKEREFLKRRLERRFVKASKVSESYTNYFEQYIEFDPFITPPDPSNPWITDSTDFWDMEKSLKDIPQRRVRRWGFSIHELLKDPSGRELFRRFLEKEYSSENLRFYEVCSELRYSTNKDIATKVENIYNEFLAPYAHCPINIDSRVMAITKTKMGTPDRHTYDEAREHIFNLMTRDSYNRFLRSDIYRDSLNSARKKLSKKY